MNSTQHWDSRHLVEGLNQAIQFRIGDLEMLLDGLALLNSRQITEAEFWTRFTLLRWDLQLFLLRTLADHLATEPDRLQRLIYSFTVTAMDRHEWPRPYLPKRRGAK